MAVDAESSHDPLHQSLKESFTFPCDDEADDDDDDAADADDADASHELQFHAPNAHCAWEHSSPEDPEKPEIHEFEFRIDSSSELKTKMMMMSDGDGVLSISPADDLFCNGYILPLNHSAGRGDGGASMACRNWAQDSQEEGAGGNHGSRHLPAPSLLGVETLGDRQDELLPWLRDDDDDDDEDEDLFHDVPLRIDETLTLFQLQLDMALRMIQPCEPGYSSIDSDAERIRCGFSERHRRGWDSKERRAREDLDPDPRDSCTTASNPRSSFMVSTSAAAAAAASKLKCGMSSRSNGDGDGFLCRRRRGYLKLMKYFVMLKSLFLHIRKPCRIARSIPLRSSSSSSPSLSASSSSSTSSSSSSSIDHDPFKTTPWGSNATKLRCSKQPRAYSDVARSRSMLRDEACCNQLSSPREAENFIRGAIEHCKKSSARAAVG